MFTVTGSRCSEKTLPPKPCDPGYYSEDAGSEACIPVSKLSCIFCRDLLHASINYDFYIIASNCSGMIVFQYNGITEV